MSSLKKQPEFETAEETGKTTALATAKFTAVGKAMKFTAAFSEKEGVFDQATVEGLALALPRIKGEQGSLFKGDVDLGSKIRIELISFSPRWAIGCGDDKAPNSKELFRISYDKALTTKGERVDDYIAGLRAQGFDKAELSPYTDIFGLMTWSEKLGDIPEIETVLIQASKVAMGNFSAFRATQGLLLAKGSVEPSDMIEIRAEKRTSGSNKYTTMMFARG